MVEFIKLVTGEQTLNATSNTIGGTGTNARQRVRVVNSNTTLQILNLVPANGAANMAITILPGTVTYIEKFGGDGLFTTNAAANCVAATIAFNQ